MNQRSEIKLLMIQKLKMFCIQRRFAHAKFVVKLLLYLSYEVLES